MIGKLTLILVLCISWQRRMADAQECTCTCTTTTLSNGGGGGGGGAGSTPVQTTTIIAEETTFPASEPTTSEPLLSSTQGCTAAPCDQISEQVAVDASNETFLTTAINEVYATWNTTEQGLFLGYKKRIEVIIYKGTTSTDSEEEQIAKVLSGFTTNANRGANVYNIQIACWGTIRQFVECVNEIYGTNYKIW